MTYTCLKCGRKYIDGKLEKMVKCEYCGEPITPKGLEEEIKLKEVFDQYKHLDYLLSDENWLGQDFRGRILFVFWQAIKESVNAPS